MHGQEIFQVFTDLNHSDLGLCTGQGVTEALYNWWGGIFINIFRVLPAFAFKPFPLFIISFSN